MLARNGLISITGSIIPVVVTIATLPFLLSAIGFERYGALALCWLILIYVGQADWGLGRAATHRVARLAGKDEEGVREAMASALMTALVVGSAMALVAVGISWIFFAQFFDVTAELRRELLASVWLIGASTLATSMLQVMYGVLAGRERFASATTALSLSNASLPILALATAIWIDDGLVALLTATLVGRLIGVVVAGADIYLSQLTGHRARPTLNVARELLGFGFWIMAASFTAPVLVTIDRMIIGSNLGAAAVAAYSIPYQIVSRLQLIPQSLMNVLFPRFSVAEGDAAVVAARNSAVGISALFLPIVIGLIFLLEPLLTLWLGDQIDMRSVAVGMVLLCAFLLTAVAQSIAVFLQARNQGKVVAGFQLAEIAPYLVLLVFAANEYGLVGVAAAFFLRRIVEVSFFVFRSGFGSGRFWLSQLPAALGIAIALWLEPQVETLAARIALGTAIAGAAFVAAAMAAPRDMREAAIEQIRTRLSKT